MNTKCSNCSQSFPEGRFTCPRCGAIEDSDSFIQRLFWGTVLLVAGIFVHPYIESDFWRIVVLILRWISAITGGVCLLLVLIPLFERLTNPIPRLRRKKDVAGLANLLKTSSNKELRELVVTVLEEIGGASAVNSILLALQDSERLVRIKAIQALGKLGDKNAIEPLVNAFKNNRDRDSIVFALIKLQYQGDMEQMVADMNKGQKEQHEKREEERWNKKRDSWRCCICGRTSQEVNKDAAAQFQKSKISMERVYRAPVVSVSAGPLVGYCNKCQKSYCVDHAPYDISVDQITCPVHKKPLWLYFDDQKNYP
jgi:ribosomal protein L34E